MRRPKEGFQILVQFVKLGFVVSWYETGTKGGLGG